MVLRKSSSFEAVGSFVNLRLDRKRFSEAVIKAAIRYGESFNAKENKDIYNLVFSWMIGK